MSCASKAKDQEEAAHATDAQGGAPQVTLHSNFPESSAHPLDGISLPWTWKPPVVGSQIWPSLCFTPPHSLERKATAAWGSPNTTLCICAHRFTCHSITAALPDCISPLSLCHSIAHSSSPQVARGQQPAWLFVQFFAPTAGDTGPCKDLVPCQWELPCVTRTATIPTLPSFSELFTHAKISPANPGAKFLSKNL